MRIKKVINVSVRYISPKYKNVHDWLKNPQHIYIGRGIIHARIEASKWENPFTDRCVNESLKLYEKHVRSNLYDQLNELNRKTLGCGSCGCKSNGSYKCHGHILKKLLREKALSEKDD